MSSTASATPVLSIKPIRTESGLRFYPSHDGKNFTTVSALSPSIRSVISFGTEAEAEKFLASPDLKLV